MLEEKYIIRRNFGSIRELGRKFFPKIINEFFNQDVKRTFNLLYNLYSNNNYLIKDRKIKKELGLSYDFDKHICRLYYERNCGFISKDIRKELIGFIRIEYPKSHKSICVVKVESHISKEYFKRAFRSSWDYYAEEIMRREYQMNPLRRFLSSVTS